MSKTNPNPGKIIFKVKNIINNESIGVEETINNRQDALNPNLNEKKIVENTCPKKASTKKKTTSIE